MSEVRWGILGAATFAREFMGPALALTPGGRLAALATSDPAKAEPFCALAPGPRVHAGYDALIAAGGPFSFLAVGRKQRSELVEPVMLKQVWIEELADEAKSAWAVLRAFCVRNVWPVLMTLWIFFVFAAPLIIVILILWYLDSIGWQSGSGFYTIGSAASAAMLDEGFLSVGLNRLSTTGA